MDSVWCGDALFVNRRVDALTLLAAVAGRTERVLLGPACMGSFALRNPLVFAYEWASLDVLSNGRTRLVACAGGGAGPLWEAESAAMNVAPGERRKRMVENIHVLRHPGPTTMRRSSAIHEFLQRHARAEAGAVAMSDLAGDQCRAPVERSGRSRRVGHRAHARRQDRGRLDDAFGQPARIPALMGFHLQAGRDHGRDMSGFDNVLYHHINVNDDKDDALADRRRSSTSIIPPTTARSAWNPG